MFNVTSSVGASGEMMDGVMMPGLIQTDNNRAIAINMLDEFLDTPFSLEDVKSHLFLVVRPRDASTDIIRKQLLNVDLGVCLKLESGTRTGVFGVRPELANFLGENEEAFFETACQNTKEELMVKSMFSMLMETSGICAPGELEEDENEMMFVCTTKDRIHGAAALNFPEVFEDFCMEHHYPGIYIIPSSIHELILVPTYAANPEELAGMVQEINETVVAEDARLEPVVYMYRHRTGEVTIAAEAHETASGIIRKFVAP